MTFSYIIKSPEYILRPVTVDDAEFIVKLRNQPHVVGRINDTPTDVEKQRDWICAYLGRENEYYWIAETLDHRPFGTNSFYHYNQELNQIESGRWVRMADAPTYNMFAERVQMYDFAFNTLKVDKIVFDVQPNNKRVIRYHKMCGSIETGIEKNMFVIQGKPVDMMWFEDTPESWAVSRPQICDWAGIDPSVPYGEIEKISLR